MELLIEILLELVFEGSIEISSNKKVSKWIRYPLIVLIILFFMIVILGLLILGIIMLDENVYAGIFMIAITIILMISAVIKFKKIYLDKKK